MSVGYGTHKSGRPLSPVEVGSILRTARATGVTLKDCATAIGLDGTGHIGRFLRILELPDDLHHLICWGSGKGFIGFSAAVELMKLEDPEDQRLVARSILTQALSSREVRQVAQLRRRSGRTVDTCIGEILAMRPTTETRYIFIGTVDPNSMDDLALLTQAQRDLILESAIKSLTLRGATGRLGTKFYTLLGDGSFGESMEKIDKECLEGRLRSRISEMVRNA